MEICLSQEESHHALRVLRLGKGDTIRLFDGAGYFYEGAIVETGKRQARIRVGPAVASDSEPRRRLILLAGFLKGQKNDTIVQKSVELGVSDLIFFIAERSIGRIAGRGMPDSHADRWHKIVVAASKQCGRARLMRVANAGSLNEAFSLLPEPSVRLAYWERVEASATGVLAGNVADGTPLGNPDMPVCALIGPEGGLSPREINLIRSGQFVVRSLGLRILRAETAALAVSSILLHAMGELGESSPGFCI